MKIKLLELALVAIFLVFAAIAGWFLVLDADRKPAPSGDSAATSQPLLTDSHPQTRTTGRSRTKSIDEEAFNPLLARPKERLVQFSSREDYENFIKTATKSKLKILGRLDALRAVLVGFDRLSDFDGLLNPEDQTGFNFLVSLPQVPGDNGVTGGSVGFGRNALEWLGVDQDNSAWGEGVRVAVIDTGIVAHDALPNNITHIDLVSSDGSASEIHGHGTAVASLIVGQNDFTPGVSPAAQLIDVRVGDSDGGSTSFLLAQGIVAATDAGADIINISMGSFGDSSLVRNAVNYAYENGAVIVASSGNEGYNQPSFPAGNEQVYAVGGVGADGAVLPFSNTGEALDITAPGLEIPAAWTDGQYISASGTSFSSPLVAGAMVTAMSENNFTAAEAAEHVLNFSNEAGSPGDDALYGVGTLDVGRVVNYQTPGIYDIAAVSNLVSVDESSSVIAVVQNQGTETITNAEVTITTPFATIPLRINSLAPGDIKTFEAPTSLPTAGEDFSITTEAVLNPSFPDAEPENNVQASTFSLEASP